MTEQCSVGIVPVVIFSVSFVVIVVVCFIIMARRSNKRQKIKENNQLRILAEQKEKYVVFLPVHKEEYVICLRVPKDVEYYIQRAQLRTKAESPEEVVREALEVYLNLVEMYSEGKYVLFSGYKEASNTIVSRLRIDSLDKIEKKVES